MCGIAGFYTDDSHRETEARLESMTDALVHRGPDGQGYATFSPGSSPRLWHSPRAGETRHRVGLGNRRLKILDLTENGAQPMRSSDGRYFLTFNGLIYNFAELKRELPSISFRSTCDTEVLLYWLAEKGIDGLSRLNGIFAFAFYDTQTDRLLLARDPVGVKPLYTFKNSQGLYFASEIKALLPLLNGKPHLRQELMARFLLNNWIADPDTLIDGIFRLPAGHYCVVDRGQVQAPTPFWDLDYGHHENRSLDEWSSHLSEALDGAVTRQMTSDVPLAFFLSGGIDSSLLAAKASKLKQAPPTTYTIGFDWARTPVDRLDIESARVVAKQFGLNHKEIILSPSIVSLLPKVIDTLEEPIADTAALSSFLICEAARKDFTVLISGQGGDELFGGYPVYRGALASRALTHAPKTVLSALDHVAHQTPYTIAGHPLQTVSRLRKIFFSARSGWPGAFLEMRSPMRSDQLAGLIAPEFLLSQADPFAAQHALFEHARDWESRDQMLYLDFKTFLPSLNLSYTDKTSMKNSVDVRVPLLDLEVIRIAQRIPAHAKFDLKGSKICLKRMCRGFLPDSIVDRKKAGFGLPLKEWLTRDLNPLAHELLAPDRLRKQRLFDPLLPQSWLKQHEQGTGDQSLKIYSLLTLQLWMDRFDVQT
ncbi:MAG: asparagine synthase (glutamine-hydrolyzing) [Deltaproteobacteria bacterium]|nr:asparagine synthase (glutamine-hydrolyzing) [Deltaproteobacteria bacterium]MBI3295052.1 asparagine synthase (glutamine-hydrolyzing) [Deltaproteobacteria bacterium]